jgi:NAD+ kinase
MKKIRSVLLFYNSKRKKTADFAARAASLLASSKVSVTSVCVNEPCSVPLRADAAISVGGDGTALFAARHIVDKGTPLLGINAGGLGFLSGLEPRDLRAGIGEFLAGRFEVKPRSLLGAEVRRGGRRVFGPQPALNDCVLRASEARAFTLEVSCGREFLSSYFGDGMIISTPTGSTAYSLAAMGPIAHPSLDVFIINPICPHTLTHRPMVVPAGKPVTLRAGGVRAPMNIDLCLDGQESFHLEDGDAVVVRRHPRPLRLLVPPDFSWFEVLRRKLSWGER